MTGFIVAAAALLLLAVLAALFRPMWRVAEPNEIVPALRRGIEQTKKGVPALLEFITSKELTVSKQYYGKK